MAKPQMKHPDLTKPGLTNEQKRFILGLTIIKRLDVIAENRELTFDEKDMLDRTMTGLWQDMRLFAESEIRKRVGGYKRASDAYSDIIQDCAEIFYKNLRNYKYEYTPSTYFKRYFIEVAAKYIYTFSQNLTQHDANNYTKIKKAADILRHEGVPIDIYNLNSEEIILISTITGLSKKVVKSTISYALNSQPVSDEMLDFQPARILTPEESYQKKETMQIIQARLNEVLTPDEFLFLDRKVLNVDGKQSLKYTELQELYYPNMTLTQIKAKWSGIASKLSNDAAFREALNVRSKEKTTPRLSISCDNSNATNEMQKNIMKQFE